MQVRWGSDACPIQKKFVTLPTLKYVYHLKQERYVQEILADTRGDSPTHCSPPGWLLRFTH